MQPRVQAAFEKGYRVTEDGRLLRDGQPLMITKSGKYPAFGIWLDERVQSVYVHHLAAYCFYGEAAMKAPCVRHKDGDRRNVRRDNILIGTYSENEMDKDPEVRLASTRAAARKTLRHLNRPKDIASKRWCSECKKYVSKKLFGPHKRSINGLGYRCRPCLAARERVRRARV